jgi:hypothetical protein
MLILSFFRCDSLPRAREVGQDDRGGSNAGGEMSATTLRCESCGMPIDSGRYCQHCVDASGQLQDFSIRFERMVAWAMRPDATLDRTEAERRTFAYMAGMPAWRDHPAVAARRAD